MRFYDDVFRLKGGWVGIPPFFRAALPTPKSLRSPTQTLGVFKRVLRKQRTGKLDPEQKPSLQFPVTQKHVLSTPGLKHSTSQTLPRLCNQEETATKRVQTGFHLDHLFFSMIQHLQTEFCELFVVWPIGDIVQGLLLYGYTGVLICSHIWSYSSYM